MNKRAALFALEVSAVGVSIGVLISFGVFWLLQNTPKEVGFAAMIGIFFIGCVISLYIAFKGKM